MRSVFIASATILLLACAERTPVPEHPGHDHELPPEWTTPAPVTAPTETLPERAREIRIGEAEGADAGDAGAPASSGADAALWL